MEGIAESNLRRLERINKYLLIGAVILAITVALLLIADFATFVVTPS